MAKQRGGGDDVVMFTIVFPPSLFTGSVNSTIYQKYFQPVMDTVLPGFKISRENKFGKEIADALFETYALDDSGFGFELRCLSLLSRIWYDTVSYITEANIPLLKKGISQQYEKRAKEILSYIHGHYFENITVEHIARSVGISRSECFRCFKKMVNKKPVEYINEYRLSQAAKLLYETDNTITEICTACGFSGSSYFGKLFKEKFGIAPLKYRRVIQKGE